MSRAQTRLACLALLLGLTGSARAELPPDLPAASAGDCHGAAPADRASDGPIDLNTADERALLDLPGIGPARARAILAFRAAHGGFRSISQLLQIKGIGRALLKQLRPLVTLSGPEVNVVER